MVNHFFTASNCLSPSGCATHVFLQLNLFLWRKCKNNLYISIISEWHSLIGLKQLNYLTWISTHTHTHTHTHIYLKYLCISLIIVLRHIFCHQQLNLQSFDHKIKHLNIKYYLTKTLGDIEGQLIFIYFMQVVCFAKKKKKKLSEFHLIFWPYKYQQMHQSACFFSVWEKRYMQTKNKAPYSHCHSLTYHKKHIWTFYCFLSRNYSI